MTTHVSRTGTRDEVKPFVDEAKRMIRVRNECIATRHFDKPNISVLKNSLVHETHPCQLILFQQRVRLHQPVTQRSFGDGKRQIR